MRTISRKTALSELIEEYEKETGRKLSRKAYQKPIKNLEGVRVERHEQFYILPILPSTSESEPQANQNLILPIHSLNKRTEDNRIHSAHKLKFSMSYKGEQPIDGGTLSFFGRYRNVPRSVFRVAPNITIVSYPGRLAVWVHRPKGARTEEQVVQARKDGYIALKSFEAHNNIRLEGYPEQLIQSHHVVEDQEVNEALKPVFQEFAEDIEARIGSKICQTSHPGKIEHEGKKRDLARFPDIAEADKVLKGKKVAIGLERLSDFYDDYPALRRYMQDYTENLKLHIKVQEAQLKTQEAQLAAIQELSGLMKKWKN